MKKRVYINLNKQTLDQKGYQTYQEYQRKHRGLLDSLIRDVVSKQFPDVPNSNNSVKILLLFSKIIKNLFSTYYDKDLNDVIQYTLDYFTKALDVRLADVQKYIIIFLECVLNKNIMNIQK